MARVVLIAAQSRLVLAGCYSPTIPDCAYTCSADTDCPSSQACDLSANACRAPGTTGACPGGDGGVAFQAPSNYTAAQLATVAAQPMVLTGVAMLDTDQDTPGSMLIASGSGMVRLYHATTLSISDDTELVIVGSAAPIIAVDGVAEVDGNVVTNAGIGSCGTPNGTVGATLHGGGAGGTFNGHGGNGGGCAAVPRRSRRFHCMPLLVPLVGGCAGGGVEQRGQLGERGPVARAAACSRSRRRPSWSSPA